ncbi:MAG: aspartate kinase [Bdellovibrionales bacterium]|nr:aspartate kinase [Bdellovibrionales bacterium]
MIVVKKFGGTSLGTLDRIEAVADRIIEDIEQKGESPILVASAMSGETNRLISMAHQLAPHDRSPAYDMLLASGEQVSISLLAMALHKRGQKARPLLAFQLGIRTDALPSKASIESIQTDSLQELVQQNIVPVVAGFQGMDAFSNITTLGRGGSDTTAVALAAALGSDICEIYTDVPAVYTADPRLVPTAKPIESITFDEMMEMASLGSKVLHARSVELASKFNVKIHLRSTFEKREGTWIVSPGGNMMEKPVVTAVTHDPNTTVIKLFPTPDKPQFLANLFSALAKKGVIVDIITQSQSPEGQRLAFSVQSDDRQAALDTIQGEITEATKISLMDDMAKVSVVGVGMQNQFGVAARFFRALASQDIPIHLVTTSDIKISAVIEKPQLEKAANHLHQEFGLEG